jgi:dihydroorotase-like cyclic amidohydrolase
MMNLHIKNGRVIDPANGIDAVQDLYIADGKIAALGTLPAGFEAARTIDAAGLVVAPGLVDLSARLREPGYEYKATLESEMQAAVQGGVTTLVCPPDTDPVLDEPGLVEMLKHRARLLNQANVHPLGALTMGLKGKALTEMAELTESGCIGFSQAEEPIEDTTVLLRAMQYAKTFGYTVWLRPQDAHIGRGGIAHSGPLASRLGLSGVPVMSETIALHTIFELMRAALLDGTVDAVCSDHTPVDDEEKLLPFAEASPGATGLELLLSLVLKWAEEQSGAGTGDSLARALSKITHEPARMAGLPAGTLSVGANADVVVFDPHVRWQVAPTALASQGKHTPFLGYELPGQVKATIVAGHLAWQR